MMDLVTAVLVVNAIFNGGLAFFILRGNQQNPTNVFFGIFLIAMALWSLVIAGFQNTANPNIDIIFARAAYAVALLIAASFYFFSYSFPENKSPSKKTLLTVGGITLLYFAALFIPDYLIKDFHIEPGHKIVAQLGVLEYTLFFGLFIFLFFGGCVRLWNKFFTTAGQQKNALLVIATSVVVAGIGGVYFNLFLASPLFADFKYLWTGPLFTTIIAVAIMYSVFRFHLFNAKVIATELLIALLSISTFFRTVLAINRQEQIFNAVLFVLSTLIGSLLVKSVYKEVRQRELIEAQEKKLEETNERLRILDQQKSEFLSFASHQLRTPLTAIKWSSGALLDGTYGDVHPDLHEPIQNIFDESAQMATLVNDYLNVSRIEQGKIEYTFAPTDVSQIVRSVAAEQQMVASAKGLTLSVKIEDEKALVWGDAGKLTQVFGNIIDNAIKYTKQGGIAISLKTDTDKGDVHIEITDTGIGMSTEDQSKVFNKFVRANNAKAVNSAGSGLGLFIVKTFVLAHKGIIRIESKGVNMGTTFILDFPLLVHSDALAKPVAVEKSV